MTNREFQLTLVRILSDIGQALVDLHNGEMLYQEAVSINNATFKLEQAIEEKHRDKTLDEKFLLIVAFMSALNLRYVMKATLKGHGIMLMKNN